jgi:hypothetical protein
VIHRHHWTGALDADGTLAWTRHGTTIITLPRHHRRLRRTAPDDDGDPDIPF